MAELGVLGFVASEDGRRSFLFLGGFSAVLEIMGARTGLGWPNDWSLALQGNRHLSFEVACRVSDHPEFLGSSYRFSEAVEIVDSTVGSVVLRSAAADWRLELLTEGEIQTSHENRQICMGPRLAVESTPATVRWTYRIGPA